MVAVALAISARTTQAFDWVDPVAAQRWRASCSAFVGRPRGRRFGGGSAGRVELIQANTSCSYQHRRRLPGIFHGRGIRWLYFELVAKVRIVVTLLPSNRERSSVKSTLTGVGSASSDARTTGAPVCASGSRGIPMSQQTCREPTYGSLSDQRFRDRNPIEIEARGWRKLNPTSVSRRAFSRYNNPPGRWPRKFGRSAWSVGVSLNSPRDVQALPEQGRRVSSHSDHLPHWFVVHGSLER